jgi:hypothetical protein
MMPPEVLEHAPTHPTRVSGCTYDGHAGGIEKTIEIAPPLAHSVLSLPSARSRTSCIAYQALW